MLSERTGMAAKPGTSSITKRSLYRLVHTTDLSFGKASQQFRRKGKKMNGTGKNLDTKMNIRCPVEWARSLSRPSTPKTEHSIPRGPLCAFALVILPATRVLE